MAFSHLPESLSHFSSSFVQVCYFFKKSLLEPLVALKLLSRRFGPRDTFNIFLRLNLKFLLVGHPPRGKALSVLNGAYPPHTVSLKVYVVNSVLELLCNFVAVFMEGLLDLLVVSIANCYLELFGNGLVHNSEVVLSAHCECVHEVEGLVEELSAFRVEAGVVVDHAIA